MSKPAILIVPGSFHPPELWAGVEGTLQKQGYKVTTIDILSNKQFPEVHEDIFQKEVVGVRKHVEKLLDAGEDLLLVMHSYGAIPATDALEGLAKSQRQAAGKKNGIVGLVYLCAFMMWEGSRLLEDVFMAVPQDQHGHLNLDTKEDGWQFCTNPMDCFYHDVPKDVAEDAASKLVPRDVNMIRAKLTYPAYKHIPSTYVKATEDRAIVDSLQDMMIGKVRAEGANIEVVTWNTAHSPFLVDPKMVADFIADEAVKRSATG